METLTKEELLSGLTNLISEQATRTVNEVILDLEKRNPSNNIDDEMRKEALEQAVSNLTFQSGHFHTKSISDIDNLKSKFNAWFAEDAKPSLVHTIKIFLEPEKK